jgi:hypothetical protein
MVYLLQCMNAVCLSVLVHAAGEKYLITWFE